MLEGLGEGLRSDSKSGMQDLINLCTLACSFSAEGTSEALTWAHGHPQQGSSGFLHVVFKVLTSQVIITVITRTYLLKQTSYTSHTHIYILTFIHTHIHTFVQLLHLPCTTQRRKRRTCLVIYPVCNYRSHQFLLSSSLFLQFASWIVLLLPMRISPIGQGQRFFPSSISSLMLGQGRSATLHYVTLILIWVRVRLVFEFGLGIANWKIAFLSHEISWWGLILMDGLIVLVCGGGWLRLIGLSLLHEI